MKRRKADVRIEMRERVRGGEGTIKCLNLLEKSECHGKVNICAIMNLEPGQSVGLHTHGPDAEIYYLLSGRLTVTDHGVHTYLDEGDTMFTGDGESHSAMNESDQPAQLLAIVLA
jgi:mannose-6-phosphate isomerase-like protein (cupin superfamily)